MVKPYNACTIVRRDRNRHGGGVLLIASKQYQIKECTFNNYNIESAWYECKLGGEFLYLVVFIVPRV